MLHSASRHSRQRPLPPAHPLLILPRVQFVAHVQPQQKPLLCSALLCSFCYDRLSSLLKALEVTNTDDFIAIQMIADFGTLLGTYARGFAVIIEPHDERLPHIPDPVLQLR
jgi:hypothetical protein